MIFTTLIPHVNLPRKIITLEEKYMCPTTRHRSFKVDTTAVGSAKQDEFSAKLCSTDVFISLVWSAVKRQSTDIFTVHSRVIQNDLPYNIAIEAGLKPVPVEALATLVWETNPLKRNLEEFPLGRGVNAINHVLFPLYAGISPGVCSLTRQATGKMSFMSPLNPRPKSFPPGTFLLFTA